MTNLETIFNEKWIPEPYSGCWLWLGVISGGGSGYGSLSHNGKRWSAHRMSWLIHFGEIPQDMWVLHYCDTPACVNPSHLFLGNRSDNTKDAMKKGRMKNVGQFGIKNPANKLSDAAVAFIRARGKRPTELAKMFGVNRKTIWSCQNYVYHK